MIISKYKRCPNKRSLLKLALWILIYMDLSRLSFEVKIIQLFLLFCETMQCCFSSGPGSAYLAHQILGTSSECESIGSFKELNSLCKSDPQIQAMNTVKFILFPRYSGATFTLSSGLLPSCLLICC